MSRLLRTTERRIDRDWYVCEMSELNKGDTFRLHEPTGELVGEQNWVAESDPRVTYENGRPIYGIEAKGENND